MECTPDFQRWDHRGAGGERRHHDEIKTARNINGVRFDGSADININTLVSRGRVTALEANAQGTSGIQLYEAYNNGYPSPYGNVLTLKVPPLLAKASYSLAGAARAVPCAVHIRSRRDTDSSNWSDWAQVYTSKDSIPGVNAKGDQDTSGNAATATRLQTARTINSAAFDGSKDIELAAENLNLEQTVELAAGSLQKNQNGADIQEKIPSLKILVHVALFTVLLVQVQGTGQR